MRKFLCVLVLPSLALASCGGGSSSAPPPPPPPPSIAVSVSPSSATIPAGGTQQFSASVSGTSNTSVAWQVNGTTGGDSSNGTISSSGLYTAPKLPPPGGSITVTAVSQADSTKSGSASAKIAFSNASVSGAYAFSFSGVNTGGTFFIAGRFDADGTGNIVNGAEDLNDASGVFQNLSFTGSYSVGSDGRGTAAITSSQGTSTFHFALDGRGHASIVDFEATATGSGLVAPQDTSALSLSSIAGNWSFGFGGEGASGIQVSAGRFTLDNAGNISAGAEDLNDAGTISANAAFTGTASTVDANGRGTASFTSGLGTSNFAFYVVTADEVAFVSLDFPSPALSGVAGRQSSSSFGLSSLSGDYTFFLGGASTLGADVDVGRVTSDANGNLNGGVFDENDAGTLAQNQGFTGTYTMASNGRGTVTLTSGLGTSTFALYMISSNRAFLVETDTTAITVGNAYLQSGGPFSNSTVSGSYVFNVSGEVSAAPTDIVGQIVFNSSGNLTGIEDANEGGTLVPNAALSGSCSVAASGRGTCSLNVSGSISSYAIYTVDPTLAFVASMDTGDVLAGPVSKQF